MARQFAMWILVFSVSLFGCASPEPITNDYDGPGPEEAVVVLGVRPDGTRLNFSNSRVQGQGVWQGSIYQIEYEGLSKDGYIVGRTKGGQTLALTHVAAAGSRIGALFSPCGGQRTLVFEVPKGEVVYVTDIELERLEFNKLGVRYSEDLTKAREYVRANFPRLRQPVRKIPARVLPTQGMC
jgi:hypothetical protein